MIYFDSCYLAKLYLMEPDSRAVRARASAAGRIVCCIIGWGEVISTFHRHLREGRLSQREFQLLTEQAEADVQGDVWHPLPLTTRLVETQVRVMKALPPSVYLRSADALHLACAASAGLGDIYSSDQRLVAAAPHFGLHPITL